LSFKQFAQLTGQKENLLNNITYKAIRIKIQQDHKKNPNLLINNYTADKQKNVWLPGGAVGKEEDSKKYIKQYCN